MHKDFENREGEKTEALLYFLPVSEMSGKMNIQHIVNYQPYELVLLEVNGLYLDSKNNYLLI